MESIQRLADRIDRRWRERRYEIAAFAEVAELGLAETDREPLGAFDAAQWVLSASILPPQTDLPAAFGHPPVTVYKSDRFTIEVIYWLSGSTAIHEHAFTGVFSVLAGSSLHAHYTFRRSEDRGDRLRIGALELAEAELLAPGDVRRIEPGEELIHSLLHLDQPTVSLIVRAPVPWSVPQFYYLPPGLALAPNVPPHLREQQVRRVQVLGFLARIEHAGFDGSLEDLLGRVEADEAVELVLATSSSFRGRASDLNAILRRAFAGDDALVRQLVATIRHERRTSRLVRARDATDDPELRFLLSVLIVAHTRGRIEALVAARYPDVSAESWLDERLARLRAGPGDGAASIAELLPS
ncbi:MAG: hypothetical protein GY711_06055 [bacterium]|nr:hypothetical protein [bacterium]